MIVYFNMRAKGKEHPFQMSIPNFRQKEKVQKAYFFSRILYTEKRSKILRSLAGSKLIMIKACYTFNPKKRENKKERLYLFYLSARMRNLREIKNACSRHANTLVHLITRLMVYR